MSPKEIKPPHIPDRVTRSVLKGVEVAFDVVPVPTRRRLLNIAAEPFFPIGIDPRSSKDIKQIQEHVNDGNPLIVVLTHFSDGDQYRGYRLLLSLFPELRKKDATITVNATAWERMELAMHLLNVKGVAVYNDHTNKEVKKRREEGIPIPDWWFDLNDRGENSRIVGNEVIENGGLWAVFFQGGREPNLGNVKDVLDKMADSMRPEIRDRTRMVLVGGRIPDVTDYSTVHGLNIGTRYIFSLADAGMVGQFYTNGERTTSIDGAARKKIIRRRLVSQDYLLPQDRSPQ